MNLKTDKLQDQKQQKISAFLKIIKRIERRLLIRRVMDSLPSCLILAETAGIVFVVLSVLMQRRISVSPMTFIALTGIIGAVAALVSSWAGVQRKVSGAESIDRAYALEERFLTSYSILRNTNEQTRSAAERVQIEDSFNYLPKIKPNEVISLRCPRPLFYVVLPLAILLTILIMTIPNAILAVDKAPNETVVDIIQKLQSEIQEPLREMVRENPENENIKKLDIEVTQLLHDLEEAKDDPKKGLAIISSMERQIKEAADAFQIKASDLSFRDIAGALVQCEATQAAAEALLEGDYDKAANELENIDFDKISAQERQKLAQKLKNAAKTIRSRKQEQLAQLTEQLAEELQSSKCSSCKNTACKFAGKCRTQKSNKTMAEKLNCQLARLGLCKSNCAGACASCELNCSNKNEKGGKSVAKGASDSAAAGSETASNPLTGYQNMVETERELHQIKGEAAEDGSSAKRVTKTDERPDEKIKTEYRDSSPTFQQESENVLLDEDIPLDRREVIRTYFESIRPSENGANQ